MKRFYLFVSWLAALAFLFPTKEVRAQEQWVAAFNIGSGCLMSGLRSIGNENSFFKECAYGALGGTFVWAGMKMVSSEPKLGPLAHLTNSLGVSIWENQIAGRGPVEEYRAFVGPFDLRYNFRTGSFRPRILVGPVLAIGRSVVTGERFLARESFQTMTIIFELEEFSNIDGVHWAQGSHGTIMMSPLEVFKDRGGYFDAPVTRDVLRHELVHSLQYRRFGLASSIPPVAKLENKLRFFSFAQDASWLTTKITEMALIPTSEYRPTEMEAYAFLPASHFDFWR